MENRKSLSIKKEKLLRKRLKNRDWAQKLKKATGKTISFAAPSPKIRFGWIYLLIDCSSSMAGDKIQQAKNGALGFINEALSKNYSVGLVSFASDAELLMEPQKSMNSLESVVQTLVASGSTNMSKGINIATQNLQDKFGEKVMCIVTDGMPDNPSEAIEAAQIAKENGIDIMTIGTDGADTGFLERLATKKELSVKVERKKLSKGITDMARLLGSPNQ